MNPEFLEQGIDELLKDNIESATTLLSAAPQDCAARHNLALCAFLTRDFQACADQARSNATEHAWHVPSYNLWALALLHHGDHAEALRVLGQAQGVSKHPQTQFLRSRALKELGDLEASAQAYALATLMEQHTHSTRTPNLCRAYVESGERFVYVGGAARLLDLLYTEALSGRDILALHMSQSPPPVPRDRPRASGTLRLAFISEHFRSGSVFSNAYPLIRELARRRVLDISCIDVGERPGDEATELLQQYFQSPATAASNDVLVDLDGWTGSARSLALLTEATDRGFAGATVSHIGYPHSTGHSRVSHKITDSIADPPGALYSERLLYLDPCFLCWLPPPHAPTAAPPDGAVRLLANHNLSKLVPFTLQLYRRILNANAGWTLIVKASSPHTELQAAYVYRHLGRENVQIIDPPESLADYHQLLSSCHLALDAYPYNATITCLECLHADTPVLTLAGQSHRSRVGASILTAIDRQDLIARDPEAFVKMAGLEATRRRGVRQALLKSPICRYDVYAARFENLMQTL